MAKSSIHFQGIKSNSEGHNLRLNSNLDYVFSDLSHQNENYTFTENISEETSNSEHINFLKNLVKQKTGRAAQSKAHMLQEGVFNFNPEHTGAEIIKAIRLFCDQMQLKPVKLSIHRDEGHIDKATGARKLNLHAHLTVEWVNRMTGKSHKWDKKTASEAQTVLAECLGMERGKQSSRAHLDALNYKIQAREALLEEIELKHKKLAQILESKSEIIKGNYALKWIDENRDNLRFNLDFMETEEFDSYFDLDSAEKLEIFRKSIQKKKVNTSDLSDDSEKKAQRGPRR